MDDTLLTIAEVAELLKLNPETVPNWLWYPRLRLTLQHLDRI